MQRGNLIPIQVQRSESPESTEGPGLQGSQLIPGEVQALQGPERAEAPVLQFVNLVSRDFQITKAQFQVKKHSTVEVLQLVVGNIQMKISYTLDTLESPFRYGVNLVVPQGEAALDFETLEHLMSQDGKLVGIHFQVVN